MTALPLAVYGAGGLGREIMQIARAALSSDEYRALGYIDDGVERGTILNGYPVLGGAEYLEENAGENLALVIGIASPEIKAGIAGRFGGRPGITFPSVVHPGAFVSEYASLGRGAVIAAGCVISVDAALGDFVFFNNYAVAGHDARIGKFSSVMPFAALSGWVNVGERCLIGAHSSILQKTSVGEAATVGMGSVVIRDVPDGATVMGNPARRMTP